MTTPDPNELLMGGGGSSIPALKVGPGKFTDPVPHSQPGEFKGGKIVAPAEAFKVMKRDDRGNLTNEQATFPSGDPIWGVVVTVQTTDRDPAVEGDDGRRRIFIDGSLGKDDRKFDSRRRAVRDAVEAANAPGLELGGELWIAWTQRVDTGGAMPATNWTARYVAAASNALGVTTPSATPAPQAAPQPAAPVQQYAPPVAAPPAPPVQAPAPAAQQFSPEQLAAMAAAGVDVSQFQQPAAVGGPPPF